LKYFSGVGRMRGITPHDGASATIEDPVAGGLFCGPGWSAAISPDSPASINPAPYWTNNSCAIDRAARPPLKAPPRKRALPWRVRSVAAQGTSQPAAGAAAHTACPRHRRTLPAPATGARSQAAPPAVGRSPPFPVARARRPSPLHERTGCF